MKKKFKIKHKLSFKQKNIFLKTISIILLTVFLLIQLSLQNISFANNENKEKNPILNSRRYIIFDRLSKRALYGKDIDKETAMASTTKIMTAIIVLENCNNLKEEFTIPEKVSHVQGSTLGLKKDDKITLNDLLYGLLLRSGNDCAVALSIAIAENTENFISLMNKKSKDLGLTKTHFVTPHGLDDPNHYTTPYELALITDYALKNEKFAKIVKTVNYTIQINNVPKEIKNTNEVLCNNVEGVYGVKTGFTNNAGRCLVTSVKRNNLDFIIIVLAADSRKYRAEDTVKLINYAFKNYRYENLETEITEEFNNWQYINLERITVNKAQNKLRVVLGNYKIKSLATNKDITFETNAISYKEAPIQKNEKVGNIIVKNGEEIIETIDILAANNVERRSIKDYYKMLLKVYA